MSSSGLIHPTLQATMSTPDSNVHPFYSFVCDDGVTSTLDWPVSSPTGLQFTEISSDSVLSSSISKDKSIEDVKPMLEEMCEQESDQELISSSSPGQKEDRSSALKYPPCAVCTGTSSGLHYGCYTCEACKNFFRRYLLRSDGLNCKKHGDCAITNRSRGNCSGCRLKKCLEVGMSKEKSKIGRYTHAQRTETIREVNKLEGKNMEEDVIFLSQNSCEASGGMTVQPVVNEIKLEEDPDDEFNAGLVTKLVEAMDTIQPFGELGSTPEGRVQIIKEHYEKYLAKVKLFGPLRAIPKEEYFTLLKLYNIDLDERWNIFKRVANNCEHIVRRYVDFAYIIPGFKQQLSKKDQEILLKLGHSDFFVILMHEGYIEEYNIFLEMNGMPSHIEEAANKIFSRTLIELQCSLFLKWQKLKLSKEEVALLIAMAIVSSDRCELENKELVEEMHTKLTNLLMKYLEDNYGKDAKKRFSKIVDILVICRYGSELYYKEYQELSQDQMVTDVAPKFPTLCPEKTD